MSSFFLCSSDWEKEKEITLEDMGSDSSEDVYLMEDTVLSDLIDDEGQRLLFTFDYMTDRSFFMEMKELIPGKTLMDPVCTLSLGKAPAQTIDFTNSKPRPTPKPKPQPPTTSTRIFTARNRSTTTNSTSKDSTK